MKKIILDLQLSHKKLSEQQTNLNKKSVKVHPPEEDTEN